MKNRLCAYGDCQEEKTRVTLNYHGDERPAFCCADHAALWLIDRCRWGQPDRDLFRAEIEHELAANPARWNG